MNRLLSIGLLSLLMLNVFGLSLLRLRFEIERDQLAATRCEVRTDPSKAPVCRAHCVWVQQVESHQQSDELPQVAFASLALEYQAGPALSLPALLPSAALQSARIDGHRDGFYLGTAPAPLTPPPLA